MSRKSTFLSRSWNFLFLCKSQEPERQYQGTLIPRNLCRFNAVNFSNMLYVAFFVIRVSCLWPQMNFMLTENTSSLASCMFSDIFVERKQFYSPAGFQENVQAHDGTRFGTQLQWSSWARPEGLSACGRALWVSPCAAVARTPPTMELVFQAPLHVYVKADFSCMISYIFDCMMTVRLLASWLNVLLHKSAATASSRLSKATQRTVTFFGFYYF